MSAWTNGKFHVVLGPAGLSVHRADRVELILSTAQLGGPVASKKGKPPRVHPLAVTTDGKHAYTIDAERKLIRAALELGGPTTKFPWDISDLAPADGGRVFAAYVTGTKARALTSIVLGVPPADPKAKWEHEYEGDRPSKVDWPDGLLWDKPQWSRKTRWTIQPELLFIDANAHGYAVYDTDSAVVGVLRRAGAAAPAAFNAVLRTPMDTGTTVAATATATSVLIATATPEGLAVICEFDDAGKLLLHRKLGATSVGPITHAGDRVFALVQPHGVGLSEQRRLAIFGRDLSPQTELELPSHAAAQARLSASADGNSFLLVLADAGGGSRVLDGRLGGSGWTIRELDLTAIPEPNTTHEAPIATAEIAVAVVPTGADGKPLSSLPRIIAQAPWLSLDPNQPNEAWIFVLGEPLEIVLNAVSVGGPAETGLYVEMSGAALDKGLIEPEQVRVEGQNAGTASFERRPGKRVATLPDLRIPAGVEPNKDKKIKPKDRFLDNPEDTFVTIRILGRVTKLGTGELLYVRVGFERLGQEGSLMRGRPISVFTERPLPPPPPVAPELAEPVAAEPAEPTPASE